MALPGTNRPAKQARQAFYPGQGEACQVTLVSFDCRQHTPAYPAPLGAAAGAFADAGDLDGALLRLRSFVEAAQVAPVGEGQDGSRRTGAAGAARAAARILATAEPPDREVAEQALRSARALGPSSPEVARLLGEALLRGGDSLAAIEELERAVALDPAAGTAWAALARARVQTGRVQNYALGIAIGLIVMAGAYLVIAAS